MHHFEWWDSTRTLKRRKPITVNGFSSPIKSQFWYLRYYFKQLLSLLRLNNLLLCLGLLFFELRMTSFVFDPTCTALNLLFCSREQTSLRWCFLEGSRIPGLCCTACAATVVSWAQVCLDRGLSQLYLFRVMIATLDRKLSQLLLIWCFDCNLSFFPSFSEFLSMAVIVGETYQ